MHTNQVLGKGRGGEGIANKINKAGETWVTLKEGGGGRGRRMQTRLLY